MTTTRSTRSSMRLSSVPSTEPSTPATPSRRRALRGSTPKSSAATPRSKRKAATRSEPKPGLEPSPAPVEEEETAPVGEYFTNPDLFSRSTFSRSTTTYSRSRTMLHTVNVNPQPTEPSRPSETLQPADSEQPADTSRPTNLSQSAEPTLPKETTPPAEQSQPVAFSVPTESLPAVERKRTPSPPLRPSTQVPRQTTHVAETQALYDRIARNGYLARTHGRQGIPAAEEAAEAAPEKDQQLQEQNSVVAAPAPAHVPGPATPRRNGWGWPFTPLKTVLNFFSPARPPPQTDQPPATAPPVIVLAPEQEKEIHDALTPAPQPRRKAPQTARPKSRAHATASTTEKPMSSGALDSFIVSRALESIDPRHRDKAREWVEQAALKLAEEAPGKPGEKRKRFESGLKVADIKETPAHYPWEQEGAFGLLDDFDDSDDEAPAWYVLDQLANNRPLKRRKAAHGTVMDQDIPSLNDLDRKRSSRALKRKPLFNSHGNSAQLNDLRPRSAIVPSPMFDQPQVHQPNGNIFKEDMDPVQRRAIEESTEEFGRILKNEMAKKQKAKQDANSNFGDSASDKENKRAGHVADSGSFTVPDSDSSSDNNEEVEYSAKSNGDSSWLKRPSQQSEPLQPPPPPIPAHATLPSPIKASPVVPPIQRETSPVREDPVKIQRALAMKHTPAKPSRLREAMLPSPSLLSEAGNDSIIAFDDPNVTIINDDDGMPQYMPLDLDMDIEEYVTHLVESNSFKLDMASAWGGADIALHYDEDEEL